MVLALSAKAFGISVRSAWNSLSCHIVVDLLNISLLFKRNLKTICQMIAVCMLVDSRGLDEIGKSGSSSLGISIQ